MGRYPDLVGRACLGNGLVDFEAERMDWKKQKQKQKMIREVVIVDSITLGEWECTHSSVTV